MERLKISILKMCIKSVPEKNWAKSPIKSFLLYLKFSSSQNGVAHKKPIYIILLFTKAKGTVYC